MCTSNEERANRAWYAVERYKDVAGAPDDPQDADNVAADLLCDLRHYCDEQGIDFERALRTAEFNYNGERAP